DRSRSQAPHRGDQAPDRGGDAACAPADPRRGRRVDADRDDEGDGQGARRRRPPAPDRGVGPRPRLLRARGGGEIAAVHRRYAKALFEAAKEKGRLDIVHEQLSDFATAVRETPRLRAVLRNPELDSATT